MEWNETREISKTTTDLSEGVFTSWALSLEHHRTRGNHVIENPHKNNFHVERINKTNFSIT